MTHKDRADAYKAMLLLIHDNLRKGMSKSIQRLQAAAITEILEEWEIDERH